MSPTEESGKFYLRFQSKVDPVECCRKFRHDDVSPHVGFQRIPTNPQRLIPPGPTIAVARPQPPARQGAGDAPDRRRGIPGAREPPQAAGADVPLLRKVCPCFPFQDVLNRNHSLAFQLTPWQINTRVSICSSLTFDRF